MDSPSLADAQARGLAGTGKDSRPRLPEDGSLRPLVDLTGNGGCFWISRWSVAPTGDDGIRPSTEVLIDVGKLSKAGKRDAAHDCSTAHLPLIATSSS